MLTDEIRQELFKLADLKYLELQSHLTPSLSAEDFIGVRTPQLRKLAKTYAARDDIGEFLDDLPHKYFDENQLHAFIISLDKDFESCMAQVERFLPYVDNWATCDQMIPKCFAKHKDKLLQYAKRWLKSDKTYIVRFGIKVLMDHFLDERFDVKYVESVAKLRSEEYYIKMMQAWYFATALAVQYDSVLPFLIDKKLDPWTHNKAIQKAVESYRITDEQKQYLKTLKVRKKEK